MATVLPDSQSATTMATVTSFMVFLLCLSVLLPAASESRQTTENTVKKMPCSCTEKECNCCADMNVEKIKFKTTGCLKYKYDLSKSLFNLHAHLNNVSLIERKLTARKTHPICIPVPQVPFLKVCVRLRDIHWEDQKLHVCANLELQLVEAPVVVLPFDCLYFGAGGIGVDKTKKVPTTSNNTENALKT